MELKGYLNSRNIFNSFDKIILKRTVTQCLKTVGLPEMIHPSVMKFLDVTQMKLW